MTLEYSYFTDGVDTVRFPDDPDSSHVTKPSFLSIPHYPSRVAMSDPEPRYATGVNLHRIGGGSSTVRIQGMHEEDSAGDAEGFAHVFLRNLGNTGLGTLVVHERGYAGCYFTQGSCNFIIGANKTYITYNLTFVRSAPKDAGTTNPADDGSITDVSGGNSDGSFTFDGNALGVHAVMDGISVTRPPLVRVVPRCRGVRVREIWYGRKIQFDVTCWIRKAPDGSAFNRRGAVEQEMQDFYRTLGMVGGSKALAGNGNSWGDCVFTSFQPGEVDTWWTVPVNLSFEQQYYPSLYQP